MEENIFTRRILIYIAICMLMVCITGCGRKNVEYADNTLEDETVLEGTDSEANPEDMGIMVSLGAGEKWEEIYDVAIGKFESVEVNAQVEVPPVTDLKVVKAKEKYFDENDRKMIIEVLSEGDVYYHDTAHLTKDEWEISSACSKYEYLLQQSQINDVNNPMTVEDYEELERLQAIYDNLQENHTPISDYSADEYIITYNGVQYIVDFESSENCSYVCVYLYDSTDLLDEESEYVYCESAKIGEYGSFDQRCSLAYEDIAEHAYKFLDELGITGFEIADNKDLRWENEELEEYWYDGCVLTLYRDIDGMLVDGEAKYYQTSQMPVSMNQEYGLEYIELYINDDGIIKFTYRNPLEITDIEAEYVNVLTYDSVKTIFKDFVTQYHYEDIEDDADTSVTMQGYSSPGNTVLEINRVELAYYRCKGSDESDEYSIIPVWRFSYIESDGDITRSMLMNAIDGSYIDYGDDLYY